MSETTHEQQPVATPKSAEGLGAHTPAGVGALSATLGNQSMSSVFGGSGSGRGQAVGAAGRPPEAGASASAPGDDLIVARMADVASDRRARRRSHPPAALPSTPTLARDKAAPATEPVTDAGQAFELKIDVNSHPTVNLSGRVVFSPQKSAATVGTGDGGKAAVLDRKISVAKGLGKPWATSFAARLAKWEPETGKNEIYPGVTVTTDIQALEAKLEADKDIDISLLKVGIQIDADLMQLAPPEEWAELAKHHGFSVRVMGRAEWKLSAAQASGLAKVKAATEKSKKLAEEATALAEKNKGAMQKIQASERRAANLLKKGKQELAAAQRMRGGAAKAEAIKKATGEDRQGDGEARGQRQGDRQARERAGEQEGRGARGGEGGARGGEGPRPVRPGAREGDEEHHRQDDPEVPERAGDRADDLRGRRVHRRGGQARLRVGLRQAGGRHRARRG